MCISFGNPSEPCCGGNLAGRLATFGDNIISRWNVWNVMQDGYTEARAKRSRDITLRVRTTVSKLDGRRIGYVDVNVPQFPNRTSPGLMAVDAENATFINSLSASADFRTYQRRMLLQKTGDPFDGIWATAAVTDDNPWFGDTFYYYPKAGFPDLDPHRWLQTKQIHLTFPGVSSEIPGYFDGFEPVPSETVLVLSPNIRAEQRARTIDRNAVAVCIPAVVTGYSGPFPIAYDTAFHALGTLHCAIEVNPDFSPSQSVTPENYPTRITVESDSEDKTSVAWSADNGLASVSSIEWDANDSSRGTVHWRYFSGETTVAGRIYVQHIANAPQDEKRQQS